ncbi:hypothetical protein HanXRQr2_Chr11g0511531 [Helianthus annuus]|uniref:Uncharacterized protein n=1 Tax=Helianthus annuus TaxID=4232 RepID=A0A251TE50_HELAN|nr:hypothetical protein HanXRQr2_Chr11g0511531 [Helianthus annuus]KAJ0876833.1 hypothetical protein HanPSC8_Chr11g0492951 [Helianthus annuus]
MISVLEIGGRGVGNLSTPDEALRVHQDWIKRRSVWFGVGSMSATTCLVTGQTLFFRENSQFSMVSRS